MLAILQSGVSIFGLFDLNPAILAFCLVGLLFGGLNLIEFKRFM